MVFLKKKWVPSTYLIITKLNYLFLGETPEVENLKRFFNQKDDLVSARKNDLEQKLMSAKTKLEHENISVQVSTRAGSSCQVGKKSWQVTGLWTSEDSEWYKIDPGWSG